MAREIRLALGGDVMTGRGIDQILAHPGPPELREPFLTDARLYVDLAEHVNGVFRRPVDPTYPWGDALAVMDAHQPALRLLNLETAVTAGGDFAPAKRIHYRMNPANAEVLAAARADVWALANNHVLDFGMDGLRDTLATLEGAGLTAVGAGRDRVEAWAPAVVEREGVRAVVASVAHVSSGVPPYWAATAERPGVALLEDLSPASADELASHLHAHAGPEDLRIVSIHWGGNWGWEVPPEQREFAHRLVDAGVHLVHGHSSHHPRPAELHRGHLIVYGCGDLISDYEGIGGYERFRCDLRVLWLPTLDDDAQLTSLRLVPFVSKRLRLWRAASRDARWLARKLTTVSRDLGTAVRFTDAGELFLEPV